MVRMIGWFLALTASSSLSASEFASDAIAVTCIGETFYEYSQEGKPDETEGRVRTFVIEEDRQRVLYWNEDQGRGIDVCEAECVATFSPYKIELSGPSVKGVDYVAIFDRRDGTLYEWTHYISIGIESTFRGNCFKVALPQADTSANAF